MYPISEYKMMKRLSSHENARCDKSHTSMYMKQNDKKEEFKTFVNAIKGVREFTGWSCTKQEKGVMIDL